MTAVTRPARADAVGRAGPPTVLDRDAALVLATVVAWLLATAWLRPLMLPDEGRYAGVAWEMLRSGDWLTPTLDGLPFFHKPPLFYWITAAALRAFGLHDGATRAASLLGAATMALALYLFVRRWQGRGVARAALLVLLTQPLFFIAAQFANMDMLVAGCIAAAILLGAHAVLAAEKGSPARGIAVSAWAFAALGVLAKGLIGIVLPALVLLAWMIATRRLRRLPLLMPLAGMSMCLVIAVPWFLLLESRHPGFLHDFFVVQHFQRFSTGGFNNVQPFWFYPVVLVVFGLPWTAWLVRARHRAWWSDPDRGALRQLMGWWVVVVVLFFSLPQSKLIGYVLPAAPPLALLIAEAAGPMLRGSRWWRATALLAALSCVAIVVLLAFRPAHSTRPLGLALGTNLAAGEPVLFVDGYFYDLAFYAHLRAPVQVLEEWDRPDIAQHDNWKRELAEAARFAPATAAAVLVPPQRLADTLCNAPRTWVIAPLGAVAQHPWLASVDHVTRTDQAGLWRVDPTRPALAAALGCRQTPNTDPPTR